MCSASKVGDIYTQKRNKDNRKVEHKYRGTLKQENNIHQKQLQDNIHQY